MRISVSLQSKLIWIPFVNTIVLFLWLYNYMHYEKQSFGLWNKSVFYTVGHTIPCVIVFILLGHFFPSVGFIGILASYVIPLVIGFALVRFQKKYMMQ